MPWKAGDVDRYNKGLSDRQKRQWVAVANSVLAKTGDEGRAITVANGVVKRSGSRMKARHINRFATIVRLDSGVKSDIVNIMESSKAVSPNIGSGVDRDELPDSDFVISGERKFPVVTPQDVRDAVSSWGRYRGDIDFDTFKANLIKLAKRKGTEFVAALPESWGVSAKAQEDAPGYGPAANVEQCWNCAFYRPSDQHCERYDFKAEPEYWCDGWTFIQIQLKAPYTGINFRPPESVKNAAKRGLELRRQFGRGGTSVGVARARDLSNGKNVSPSTIRRMVSYFARHAVDAKAKNWGNASNPSPGWVAWLLWGGDAGRTWANKVNRQMKRAEELKTRHARKEEGGGKGYSARAGETIRGQLVRGADGKFTSAGSAPSAPTPAKPPVKQPARQAAGPQKPKPKPKRKPSTAKPKRSAAQVEAERQARRKLREAERQADRAKREAERQADRKKREEERQADRTKREAEREAKRQQAAAGKKPAASAGGGGKAEAKRAQNRESTADAISSRGGISKALSKALLRVADGETPKEEEIRELSRNGLIKRSGNKYILTPAGSTYTRALGTGNTDVAMRALDRARRVASRGKALNSLEPDYSGFGVFKDATGEYRWVLVSSNGYLDKDNEIVSTAALKADCERADKDGNYGPLRWWHMGEPTPHNHEQPWGSGVDLGMCDFNMMHGRFLVESGTFKSKKIAEAVARVQRQLQASIGFLHPPYEPVRENGIGVFKTIYRFERSLVPKGLAANPYTRLIVKGSNMSRKQDDLRKMLGNDIADSLLSGLDTSQKELDAQVAFKQEKTMQDQELTNLVTAIAVAVKSVLSPTPAPEPTEPTTEKAVGDMAGAAEAVADAADSMAEEAEMEADAEAESEESDVEFVADMTVDDFKAMLADVLSTVTSKMDEYKSVIANDTAKAKESQAEALRLAQETRTKEANELRAKIATLQSQAAANEAKLKELLGEQPNAAPYVASQANDNVIGNTATKETNQTPEHQGMPSPYQAIDGFMQSAFQNLNGTVNPTFFGSQPGKQ